MNNKKIIAFVAGIILSISLSLGFQFFQIAQSSTTLTISAAASLKDALEEIKPLYRQSKPTINITYNFGSSGSLQQQIEQGAPVDIFISAANKQMDALQTKNLLLPGTRRNLVSNRMVLITTKNETFVKNFPDLANANVKRISIGEPKSVPAGQYGEQVLKYFKIWDRVQSKIIFGKDVRTVLTYVESGNVNAGLVYSTDAKTSDKVRVVTTAPTQSHQPIVYPVAVIKDSKQPAAAREFVNFLSGARSQTIFRKYGFKID